MSACYYCCHNVDKDSIDSSNASELLDVNQVKDELEALEKERAKSEKARVSVDKELANAANNTKKLETVCRNNSLYICLVL